MRTKIVNSKLTQKNILKVTKKTPHLLISELVEGVTYQSHTRDIVTITKIDNEKKIITFKNISQRCNMRTEFKNVNLVKKF